MIESTSYQNELNNTRNRKMNKKNNIKARVISLILCVAFIVSAIIPDVAFAAKEERKVVRVGYVNAENYEEGGEGEYKSGFGYEYFQRISYITGWKYEYVYGSFADCYEMLKNGEIDLFGNVSYTEERKNEVLFSDYPEGKDTYWLYASNYRTDLLGNDATKLNGGKIAVTSNSFQATLLSSWLKEKNVSATVVECSGFAEMMRKANKGEVDAFVAPDLSTNYGYNIITGIGFSDYYFAVSKNRPDILKELNAALFELQNNDIDFNSNIVSKYSYKMASGLMLNADEKDWLSKHDNTITIGCLRDYLPFTGEREGQTVGVISAIIESLKEEYDINVNVKTYGNSNEILKDLADGIVDLAAPVI